MTDNEDVEVPIENNVIVEAVEEVKETESMQKPKVKKPRSEKQIEALKKAHAVRQANFAEKKRLIQLEKEQRESRMQQIKENEEQADDEEEEEDEAPVVKPKPKAKKKVKKTSKIVFENESESDEEQEIIIRKVRKNKKVEKVEPTPRPSSPINIPVVPKENKKMTSISEVEENIVEEQKKYSHSEILRMMGM